MKLRVLATAAIAAAGLVLVPAAMKLMGDWNWWMPSWLDRALPDLSFESGEPEPKTAEA